MTSKPTEIQGKLDATGLIFSVVVSRFNSIITERLLEGALDAVSRHGADLSDVEVVRVPGSWEIPLAVRKIAQRGKVDAIICLGAVIRGATPHFDYVAAETSKGIGQASMESGIPAAFGVLTTDTLEQAIERAGSKAGNKGWDAAVTAIEMANLFRAMDGT